jgi:hypothetical protein
MRYALVFLLLATAPAAAWEFTPRPVCTLSDDSKGSRVVVTHDPRLREPYEITVTGTTPWPAAPVFSMRFEGPRGLVISTERHRLSDSGHTLSVTDTGFGNVLNGLEFNDMATALAGDLAVSFPLAGAGPEVRALRACIAAPAA